VSRAVQNGKYFDAIWERHVIDNVLKSAYAYSSNILPEYSTRFRQRFDPLEDIAQPRGKPNSKTSLNRFEIRVYGA
jgi:hypothetical protein